MASASAIASDGSDGCAAEAAGSAWHPEAFSAVEGAEGQQLYVNAEHNGKVGVITLSREAYNWDVDAELNRAIDWECCNAEACAGRSSAAVNVTARAVRSAGVPVVEIEVADDGSGIARADRVDQDFGVGLCHLQTPRHPRVDRRDLVDQDCQHDQTRATDKQIAFRHAKKCTRGG